MKIKIYSDAEYLLPQQGIFPHPMLYPFWEHLAEEVNLPWMNRYDNYKEIANDLFEMSSLEQADLVVMPDDWRTVVGEVWYAKPNRQAQELYLKLAQQAKEAHKPLVVFFGSDLSDQDIHIKNAYVFRHSYYSSRPKKDNFIWPTFCEDLIEKYLDGNLPFREKQDKPTVGFCGLVKRNSWKSQIKTLAYYLYMLLNHGKLGYPPIQGHILRSKIIGLLQASSLIKTNFIIRSEMVFLGKKDATDATKLLEPRLEFLQNLVNSDYVICCRGAGNFSNRLFETLCCGRIPIFVNTDSVLPYDFAIDWKQYCVWIEEAEIPHIAEKVFEFHQKLSPQDFKNLQAECRRFWKEWLSPEGFYSKFYMHFTEN